MTDFEEIDFSGIPKVKVEDELPDIDLTGIPEVEPYYLSQDKPKTVWESFTSIWGDKTPEESAKATNSLVFSEMLNISPSKAYDIHDEISTQMRNKAPGEKISTEIHGLSGAAGKGAASSISGMMKNQKVPEPFESASQMEIWLNGLTQMGLDLPVFLSGMAVGSAGGPVTAMAGGFGLTAGVRKVLVDRYSGGKAKDFKEFQDRAIGAIKETVKGQVVGGLTGGAGKLAPAGYKVALELATMTTAGSLLEGRIPKAKDFIDNAGIFLAIWAGARGFEAVTTRKSSLVATRKALEDVYKETGATPKEVIDRISTKTKEELSAEPEAVIKEIASEIKAERPVKEEPAADPKPGETSVKNAVVDAEREARGAEPIETPIEPTGKDRAGRIESAKKEVDDGIVDHIKLAEEINNKVDIGETPTNATEKTNYQLLYGKKKIQNELKQLEKDIAEGETPETYKQIAVRSEDGTISTVDYIKGGHIEAIDKLSMRQQQGKIEDGMVTSEGRFVKRPKDKDGVDIDGSDLIGKRVEPSSELIERRNTLEDALDANEKATKSIGTAESHALSSRKDMMAEDYSVSAMVQRAREDGVEVTPGLRKKFKKISGKIEKAEKDLETSVEKISKENTEKTIKQIQNTEAKAQRKQKRTYKTEEIDAEFSGLVESLNELTKGLHAGVDPMAAKIFTEMAINRIRKGVVKAEDIIDNIYTAVKNKGIEYSKRDIRDAISQYGKTKEMSKEEIKVQLREAKRQMQLLSALEDAQKGKAPKRSGLQRDDLSDRVRELRREVNQAMRENKVQRARTPEQQWKSSLDAVKTRLKNQITDLTKQIKTGEKTPKRVGIKYDAEANALKAIRDDLKKTITDIEGKPKLSDEHKIKMAVAAVKKSIAEYERRIKEGDLTPKPRTSTTPVTPELKALRGVRDSLKETYKSMQKEAKPKKSEEQIRLDAWRGRTSKQITELERRISEKDYTAKAKKPPVEPATPKDVKTAFELNKLKDEYHSLKLQNQIDSLGVIGKGRYAVGQGLVLVKAIKSAYDVSAPGRQGMLAVLSHPIKGFKNVLQMFKALGSEEAAFRIEESIKQRPNYPLYKRGKLELTKRGGTLIEMEEAFQSRWAEAIPGIPASNRAYIAFLNLMRADLFDSVLKGVHWGKGAITDAGLKAIGDYANQSTGRGTVGGKYAASMAGLGKFLWAPKLVLSRFQMIAGKSMWEGTPSTRMAIAKEYGRILGSIATVYAISSQMPGVTIETDPRSSDFGKIKIGNRRIDPLAGLSQTTVFMSRIATGETKTSRGIIKPTRGNVGFGGMTTWDIITNFLRSKLTPVLGTAINLATERNVVGEKVTVYDIPEETLIPLVMEDIYDSMVEDGVPNGLALAVLAEFGIGVQIYDAKKRRYKERPKH